MKADETWETGPEWNPQLCADSQLHEAVARQMQMVQWRSNMWQMIHVHGNLGCTCWRMPASSSSPMLGQFSNFARSTHEDEKSDCRSLVPLRSCP
eukprot:2106624-Amphidinium_carterae.2